MAENADLAALAAAWDAGYDACANFAEVGLLRLVTQGKRGIEELKRPRNPYRIPPEKEEQ